MATSAQTLSKIISTLSAQYDFDEDKAITFLANAELLPKKLLPKTAKTTIIWASKKAEELATIHGIVPEGNGSGKDGKWTISDVEKLMAKPTKDTMLISPNALNFAKENEIDYTKIQGSGKNGRILLKDVEKLIENDYEDPLDITPQALLKAKDLNISHDELLTIHGSGKDGRVLLSDVTKYSSSEDED